MEHGDKFTRGGYTFKLTIEPDNHGGAPWDNEDGHGPVETRNSHRPYGYPAKRAGERVLIDTGFNVSLYDFAAAVKLARKDGWGWLPGELKTVETADGNWKATAGNFAATAPTLNAAISDLYAVHRKSMTAKAYAAEAAERDFKRLRAWCNDEWTYVGAIVTLCDDDGETPRPLYSESLWGIESDAADYIAEVAEELADQIIDRLPGAEPRGAGADDGRDFTPPYEP
jgi:hypothetical protein